MSANRSTWSGPIMVTAMDEPERIIRQTETTSESSFQTERTRPRDHAMEEAWAMQVWTAVVNDETDD